MYKALYCLHITIGELKITKIESETVKGKISNNDQVMQEI